MVFISTDGNDRGAQDVGREDSFKLPAADACGYDVGDDGLATLGAAPLPSALLLPLLTAPTRAVAVAACCVPPPPGFGAAAAAAGGGGCVGRDGRRAGGGGGASAAAGAMFFWLRLGCGDVRGGGGGGGGTRADGGGEGAATDGLAVDDVSAWTAAGDKADRGTTVPQMTTDIACQDPSRA